MENADVIWFEQPNFVFDCVVRILRSRIASEEDPLALLAMALLFHNLGKGEPYDAALTQVEHTLHAFPDILDSGLQLRDCLVASAYFYVASKIRRKMLAVDHIVMQRINFAATNEWFQDSSLAAIVALISDEVQVGSAAKQYLTDKADTWLDADYVLGVLHYCLVADEQEGDRFSSYLSKRDWSSDGIRTLTWGLLALGVLGKRGYEAYRTQYTIAQRILGILGSSEAVQKAITGNPNPDSQDTSSLTSFDAAFAAYALNAKGFDGIIGVHRTQREALDALLDFRATLLAQGGRLVPKRLLIVFQGSLLLLLAMILWEILRFIGIEALLQVVVEIIFLAILSALNVWFFKTRLPSVDAVSAIFGDTPSQQSPGGENHGHKNQRS